MAVFQFFQNLHICGVTGFCFLYRGQAQLLKQKGIQVYGESEIRELVDERPFYYSI